MDYCVTPPSGMHLHPSLPLSYSFGLIEIQTTMLCDSKLESRVCKGDSPEESHSAADEYKFSPSYCEIHG